MKFTTLLCGTVLPLGLTCCNQFRKTMDLECRDFVKIPRISKDFKEHRVKVRTGPPPGQQGEVTERVWRFKPVVQGSPYRQYTGEWYMVWPESGPGSEHRRGKLKEAQWQKTQQLSPEIAHATKLAFGVWPTMIEPQQVFHTDRPPPPGKSLNGKTETRIVKWPSKAWAAEKQGAHYDPVWHLRDEYSQLMSAREEVAKKTKKGAGGGVTVAILDTGYDERLTAGMPRHLEVDSEEQNAFEALHCLKDCKVKPPGRYYEKHGTSAMSILAGGHVKLMREEEVIYEGDMGGVPDAKILPYRVAPWVISPTTANLAMAIDHASREKKADVISMSHAGAPTQMWMDAVNAAHDRGTAIIGATGDYINVPGFKAGLYYPSASVYPAACRRVLGVGGVTANGTPYGKTDWSRGLYAFAPSGWTRGSYGPDGWRWRWRKRLWNDKLDAEKYGKEFSAKYYDEYQTERAGWLHPFPICGYTPNVLALLPLEKDGTGSGNLELHYGGASAAVPQVAAAAALWLAYYQDELKDKGLWRKADKAEMAHLALLASADRSRTGGKPDLYLGSGSLKAKDALAYTPAKLRALNEPYLYWPRSTNPAIPRPWAPHDIYSTNNGIGKITTWELPLYRESTPDRGYSKRMLLLPEVPEDAEIPRRWPQTEKESLRTVFMNQQLSKAWFNGRDTLKPDAFSDDKKETKLSHKLARALLRRTPLDGAALEQQARDLTAAATGIKRRRFTKLPTSSGSSKGFSAAAP